MTYFPRLLLLSALLAAATATAGELSVKLTVTEPAGAARKGESACGGVPLPARTFKKDQAFKIVGAPAQVLPLVVDERGYVTWVLVDALVDLPAKGTKELTLTTGAGNTKPASTLKVDDGADGVTVDTGRIKFTVSKSKPFALFDAVELGGKKVAGGGEVSYTDATGGAGKSYKAMKPESVVVEYSGPVRVTVAAKGRFDGDEKTKMQYAARVTAWAGRSDVHVKYSLCNSNPDHYCFREIGRSSVDLKLAGGAKPFVCDLYLTEDKPREVTVADGSLKLTGISANRWIHDSSHLSSQYLIDFSGQGSEAAAKGRLHLLAPTAWYADTQGLPVGKFSSQAEEMICYDKWGWKYDKKGAPRAPAGRGKRTGRRYIPGEDNHYETEEDIVECLLLMYLRTGTRPYYELCQAWANYNMDLQSWRTDGWRWKDGGIWWPSGGPLGNRAQRGKDPVTGAKARAPKGQKGLRRMSASKSCNCHTWGAGLCSWFLITGDRDAYEAALDNVDLNIDTQHRAFQTVPGKAPRKGFSRGYIRATYLTHAARLIAPTDDFVVSASEHLANCYLKRPAKEPRGFVNEGKPPRRGSIDLKKYVGDQGMAEMKKLGSSFDGKTGQMTDKDGHKWQVITGVATFMYPTISPSMELYYRLTGNEDAADWAIAYGQAAARIMYQDRHGQLHKYIMADFPVRGVCKDLASWVTPPGVKNAEGVKISGY
ncbi:MAG: exo-rhamnogalacturonan lyase family protein, partial [Planctomycetota bacterium]